jgi:hypothetical protein
MKKLLVAAVALTVFTLNGLDPLLLVGVIAFSGGVFAGRLGRGQRTKEPKNLFHCHHALYEATGLTPTFPSHERTLAGSVVIITKILTLFILRHDLKNAIIRVLWSVGAVRRVERFDPFSTESRRRRTSGHWLV